MSKSVFDDLGDEGMAYKIRMLTRSDLDHEFVVVAARDRILKLARENLKLRDALAELNQACGQEIAEYEPPESVQRALGLNGH